MISLALFLTVFGLEAAAQVNTPSCNSACMNYLTALTNEKNIVNSAVWDYSGPVTANQINTVCGLAAPLSCCDCGGIGLSAAEQTVLAAWALTCTTFNTVQDGGASAVNCWTSHFQDGCVDYDNLLAGGTCGSSGSSAASTTTTTPAGSASTSSTGAGSQSSSTASNVGASTTPGLNELGFRAVALSLCVSLLGILL